MNASLQAYNTYKKAKVETVAPGKLLLMLYDGAVKNIINAQKEIEDKDYNKAHQSIIKTQDIIVELMSTLNMDYEISNNLFSLYEYMRNQLVEANINKDVKPLEEVKGLLSELRGAWQEAINATNSASASNNAQPSNLSIKG
ncbi:Flagellar biosynthesis protein FliS [Candidatus Syntrophocurvum alkaliphilum]|uniref:Flagellar secretion chaperone FliS n=1 Tax=Candidatus Syntrophocurvum alkaliphilum TaxID=2293317 RepID=A0A6I6DK05_9FIRM|nr:flagellar export chaperone FliS [Candidatus Syntrophocurvum alkaliphilum]QGU00397.1 Flagellar biosynthesis protein FliS [Candidatus Syntrophocurvum alkaliphilum]